MLSDIKKPVLNEKKAFYYFGFKTVVPFSEVEKAIKALKTVAKDELIETVAKNEKICKYFDIPIQHISNKVLKRMNRRTKKEDIELLIQKIRNNF